MMYRCENCGHLFEEGEQAVWEESHGFDCPPYEKWSGCPLCRGDYEERHQCQECYEWNDEEDLYNGLCKDCLSDTITYDTFFEFCEANRQENYLDIFVMCHMLNCDEAPKYPSWDFHQLMIKYYKERVDVVTSWEKMMGKKHIDDFLDDCIRFVMDEEASISIHDYADWLNKREVK